MYVHESCKCICRHVDSHVIHGICKQDKIHDGIDLIVGVQGLLQSSVQ